MFILWCEITVIGTTALTFYPRNRRGVLPQQQHCLRDGLFIPSLCRYHLSQVVMLQVFACVPRTLTGYFIRYASLVPDWTPFLCRLEPSLAVLL